MRGNIAVNYELLHADFQLHSEQYINSKQELNEAFEIEDAEAMLVAVGAIGRKILEIKRKINVDLDLCIDLGYLDNRSIIEG